MSYSTLYLLNKKSTRPIAELPNGFGTAPVIWNYLCEVYLHKPASHWLHEPNDKTLWGLVIAGNVPRAFRLAQALCYDHAYCPKHRTEELANVLREVYVCTNAKYPNNVNHWLTIVRKLEVFAELKSFPRAQGLALNCTNVQDVWMEWKGGEIKSIFNIIGE